MFPANYFSLTYFAARFFPKLGMDQVVIVSQPGSASTSISARGASVSITVMGASTGVTP
jgi:hypothetical protein